MSNHLNIQVCIYPRFDGGFYFCGPKGPMNRFMRLALGVIDFRLWWVTTPNVFGQNFRAEGIDK